MIIPPLSPASRRPPSGATELAHVPALDGLRGLAIVLVLMHNLDVLELIPASSVAAHVFKEVLYLGWIGVQLFFVLSGYLITRGLLASMGRPGYFRNFFVKRALRIFPLYYLCLLLLTLCLPLLLPAWFGAPQPNDSWLWIYLSNWSDPLGWGGGARLPHFWSLAVEEQFYLLWPLLLFGRTPLQALGLSLALMVDGPALRWLVHQQGLGGEALYQFTICRMDALAAGAALAAWQAWRPRATTQDPSPQAADRHLRKTAAAWLSGLALLMLAALVSHGFQRTLTQGQIWAYSLLALSFVLLLWAGMQDLSGFYPGYWLRRPWSLWHVWPYLGLDAWRRLLSWPLLRVLGKYSYALYVFHKPVHDLLGEPLLQRWFPDQTHNTWLAAAYLVASMAVTFGLAWISWRVVEQPCLALKNRLVGQDNTATAAAPAAGSADNPPHGSHLHLGLRPAPAGAGPVWQPADLYLGPAQRSR